MENRELATQSREELTRYLTEFVGTKNLTAQERVDFINIAQAYQLNPFKREIHVVAYGQGEKRQCSIITGYESYIKRAERTGKLNGWKVGIAGEGENLIAKITIYRKDWETPFEHEVYLEEARQYKKNFSSGAMEPTAIWKKMPKFMLKKVAIAQGFRLCFSDELGGMPYTADEMPEGEVIDVSPSGKPTVEQPRSKSSAKKSENQSEPKPEKIIDAEEIESNPEETEKPVVSSAPDDIELIPSIAIHVDPKSTIPAMKAFIVGAETFITAKGSTATKVIIADSSTTRKFEVRLMGDRTADFYKETYYRFHKVKTVVAPEGKVFTCKHYEIIDME